MEGDGGEKGEILEMREELDRNGESIANEYFCHRWIFENIFRRESALWRALGVSANCVSGCQIYCTYMLRKGLGAYINPACIQAMPCQKASISVGLWRCSMISFHVSPYSVLFA